MAKQLFSLFAVAIAAPVVFSCCIPQQWEGMAQINVGAVMMGKPEAVMSFFNVSFDAKDKKVYLTGSYMMDGAQMTEVMLLDYSMMKQYNVINGQCTTASTTGNFPSYCISPSAKMLYSSYYGAGNDMFMMDIYQDMRDGMMAEITVTKDCIPVSFTEPSKTGITFVNYFGITPGIKDMSVFQVPTACNKDNTVSPRLQNMLRKALPFV